MLVELSKMVDLYQGDEGLVDTWIEGNINERIKMDLKEDVLAHLSGRVTYAEWISPPLALNSQVQIFAMELSDADAFEKSFESIIKTLPVEIMTMKKTVVEMMKMKKNAVS